jgi:osmotically-inducible protein OsmY
MFKLKKIASFGVLLVMVTSVNAFAQISGNTLGYSQYDTNHDAKISVQEALLKGMSIKQFETADVNHDGYLNTTEFKTALAVRENLPLVSVADDRIITAKVEAALLQNALLKNLYIQVETEHGVVQLSGSLSNAHDVLARAQVVTAGQIAAGVAGVQQVVNDLLVQDL